MDQQNPYSPPRPASPRGTRTGRFWPGPLARFCLAFYTLAILSGVQAAVIPERSASALVLGFATVLTLCVWALDDARRRQKPIPRSQKIWFFVFAVIVVPGYVIGTRGWRGIGWVVFHGVGWLVFSTLAMNVTGSLYYGDAWWEAVA
jgi:hypothetical protein